jgi:ankyrin repeat protein
MLAPTSHLEMVKARQRCTVQLGMATMYAFGSLLDAGADINALDGSDSTALHAACINSSAERVPIIRWLLESGVDTQVVMFFGPFRTVAGEGITALQLACSLRDDVAVILLLASGVLT